MKRNPRDPIEMHPASMDRKVRIDQSGGCLGCYNYRNKTIYSPFAKPFIVFYCKALEESHYDDVCHSQGHGTISMHYPIVYDPNVRLPNCPIDKQDD